jgi:G3E family GTPase
MTFTLLTGFLGAGKTTALKGFLREANHSGDIGVIASDPRKWKTMRNSSAAVNLFPRRTEPSPVSAEA